MVQCVKTVTRNALSGGMKETQAGRGFGNLISSELSLGTSRLEVRTAVVLMFPSDLWSRCCCGL